MFRFEYPYHLYVLAALPLVILLFLWAMQWRKRALRRFGNSELIAQLMPERSAYKPLVKLGLLLVAVTLLLIALANPQWGTKREKVKRKGIDVFIALDVSRSMLAQDVSPSRLARAQRFGQDLIDRLKGEQVGVIVFACNAQIQVPLTTDYAFAQLFMGSAGPDVAASQGTTIAEAISLAEEAFPEENQHHKALIILTDGEDHDGSAAAEAKKASEDGMVILTVGVGTPEGSFIPISRPGGEDYLRDRTGQPVRTQMQSKTLEDIAAAAGGAYLDLQLGAEPVMQALQQRIDGIEKREYETRAFSDYESYFQYFLAGAILFLLIEFVITYRKSRFFAKNDWFAN